MHLPFDDQTDIAAIVYKPHESPDAVLRAFARAASDQGWRIAGLLQTSAAAAGGAPKQTRFRLLGGPDHGDWLPEPASAGASRCSEALREAGQAIDAALLRRPDLLVISRFGRLEVEGGGLLAQVSLAARLNVPVVLAVPEAIFRPWLAFIGGLCVRMPCTLESVEAWWRTVSGQDRLAAPAASVCALCK